MRQNRWFLALSVVAGMSAAGAAAAMQQVEVAQNEAAPGTVRPRTPGATMAPRSGDTDLRIIEPDRSSTAGTYRTPRHEQAGNTRDRDVPVQRDLPMPRGVPSIIAP